MPSPTGVSSGRGAVRIEGLRELNLAFKLYGRGLEKGVREALLTAAEVVRPEAQSLARSSIKVSRVDWSAMRVGTSRHTSYVAPVQRGRNRNPNRFRPKLKAKLLDEAMEPALDQNTSRVEREFGDALDDLARMWSRV